VLGSTPCHFLGCSLPGGSYIFLTLALAAPSPSRARSPVGPTPYIGTKFVAGRNAYHDGRRVAAVRWVGRCCRDTCSHGYNASQSRNGSKINEGCTKRVLYKELLQVMSLLPQGWCAVVTVLYTTPSLKVTTHTLLSPAVVRWSASVELPHLIEGVNHSRSLLLVNAGGRLLQLLHQRKNKLLEVDRPASPRATVGSAFFGNSKANIQTLHGIVELLPIGRG